MHDGQSVRGYIRCVSTARGRLLRVAQETNDPTSKALLLEMAQAWINLAERMRAQNEWDIGK